MRWALCSLVLAACGGSSDEASTTDPSTSSAATGDTGTSTTGFVGDTTCADVARTHCVEVAGGDVTGLLDAANLLEDDSAIVLGEGSWALTNGVSIRTVDGVTLIGQGPGRSILDLGPALNQVNGVDVVADDFHIEALTILDAPKDGLRIEDSDGIVIRNVEATWTDPDDPTNGAYGLYPVRVRHVLMEDNLATNASDAGIYVGQCEHAIVRNNEARGNVAGLEIENTQFADVYGNTVVDNTGGLVVFDLPGNPVIGRDIEIHDNVIQDNNRPNFAPGGVVQMIPAGVGTFVMASRRVEIHDNAYARNQTVDIAILSGLVVETDDSQWHTPTGDVVGDITGLDLDADGEGVFNFRTTDMWVHSNTHEGSGTAPDTSSLAERELGFLLGLLYGGEDVDTVLYDAIGESSHDPIDPSLNSNDHRICVGAEAGSMASLNLELLAEQTIPNISYVYRPAPPFVPFDCTGIEPLPPQGVE